MAEKRVTWSVLTALITQLWAKIKANFSNKIEIVKVNGTVQPIATDKSVDITIPAAKTKLSQLTNDTGFITKAVSDLVNYYKKAETYTKAEVDSKVSAIPKFDIKVVQQLPTTGISKTTIYLVKTGAQSENLFTEYIRVADGSTDKWEKLGEQKVDLSGYMTKTEAAGTYQPKGDYAFRNGDGSQDFSVKELIFADGVSHISADGQRFLFSFGAVNTIVPNKGTEQTLACLTDIPTPAPVVTEQEIADFINSLN
jgi:hypothetical protein